MKSPQFTSKKDNSDSSGSIKKTKIEKKIAYSKHFALFDFIHSRHAITKSIIKKLQTNKKTFRILTSGRYNGKHR